jgi:hypothetical protein
MAVRRMPRCTPAPAAALPCVTASTTIACCAGPVGTALKRMQVRASVVGMSTLRARGGGGGAGVCWCVPDVRQADRHEAGVRAVTRPPRHTSARCWWRLRLRPQCCCLPCSERLLLAGQR